MGIPVQKNISNESFDISAFVEKVQTLPPNQLREFFSFLFVQLGNHQHIADLITLSTKNSLEPLPVLLLPRRTPSSILPPKRVWSDEMIENALSEGTGFVLVISESPRNELQMVWRNNVGPRRLHRLNALGEERSVGQGGVMGNTIQRLLRSRRLIREDEEIEEVDEILDHRSQISQRQQRSDETNELRRIVARLGFNGNRTREE